MMTLAVRAVRLMSAALGAAALILALLVASSGTARADVATSCANRNENSIKIPNSFEGQGESVKTVCPTAQVTPTPEPTPVPQDVAALIPTSIPAGSGRGLPMELTVALVAVAGSLMTRRLAVAGKR